METLVREDKEKLIELLRRDTEPRPLVWKGFRALVIGARSVKRLRTGGTKEYVSYKITVPKPIAESLGLEDGSYAGILLARLYWYHYYDYNDPDVQRWFWEKLPSYARAELCILGAVPEHLCKNYRTITVIASEEELKSLGLEPGQPITLRELLERAKGITGRE